MRSLIRRPKSKRAQPSLHDRGHDQSIPPVPPLAHCDCCTPTYDWLGNHSPPKKKKKNERIRQLGLWQVQHTKGSVLEADDFEFLSSCLSAGT
jgi:hypothetical protein